MDFNLEPTDYERVKARRTAYLERVTAPLDGMWETGFFPIATHWDIYRGETAIGYCALNADNALLGFDVTDPALHRDAFSFCLKELSPPLAFASTAEPGYLSLCADHQHAVTVNALMYDDRGGDMAAPVFPADLQFTEIHNGQLEQAVRFGMEAIAPMEDWLRGYYTKRIALGELFGLWRGAELIATGELRLSPAQAGIADLGVAVHPEARKRGLATKILQQLRSDGRARKLALICSTEAGNIGAQKAITAAGFVSTHRILQFSFQAQ